jgi:hypothetical protein
MLSIYIPKNIKLSSNSNFFKIQNLNNFQIKQLNINAFSLIKTGEGLRLFIKNNDTDTSIRISSMYKSLKGFSIG